MNSNNTIPPDPDPTFENLDALFGELYLKIRKKECRLYSDVEVVQLPVIPPEHLHAKEWEIRKRSSQQLIRYFIRQKKTMEILEVGCGNGWLSAKLAAIPSNYVTGIDINHAEIIQAKRVFKKMKNLRFEYGDILQNTLQDLQFDRIVFAASIQYFSSFQKIIQKALSLLRLNGEIHIMDSHFYKPTEIEAARLRTREYFESIGHTEMSRHYFHHCTDELKTFNCKILRKPGFIRDVLFRNKNPFYWVCIQNL